MNRLRKWAKKWHPWRKPQPPRTTQFAWLTYTDAKGNDLRIFNFTQQPVDTEIIVRNVAYRLSEVGVQDLEFRAKKGDHFFRLVSQEERKEIVEHRLATIRKQARQNQTPIPRAEFIRAQLHREYAGQLLVVQQDR